MMDHIRIVERDTTEGTITATLADSAGDATFRNSGFLGARRRFGELRFSRTLGDNKCLELLVNNVVKMSHPVAAKQKAAKKKKTAAAQEKPKDQTEKEDADNVENAPSVPEKAEPEPLAEEPSAAAEPVVPAATPSPEKVDPKSLEDDKASSEDSVALETTKPAKSGGKENQIINSFFGGGKASTTPKPSRRLRKPLPSSKESPKHADEARKDQVEEEDSEAEWEAEDVEEVTSDHDAREEENALTSSKTSTIRDWSAHEEMVVEPDSDDACGDQWNESSAACEKIHVLRALSTKEMASRFHELGILVLDAPSFALPASQLAKMLKRSQDHYNAKLEEAREMGIVSAAGSKLKQGEEETVEGFNQRPGGRIDMVGVVDDISEGEWPWTPFVKKVLGRDSALAYTGCVVSRPGDSDQNWHIDGLHVEKNKHQQADRVIVFCPLTELNKSTGTTEFVPRSHFLSRRQPTWSRASSMPRARHYVHAGTPIAMDYRLWHRGLRNNSNSNRLLLYCVYQKGDAKRAIEDSGFLQEKNKRLKKRVVSCTDNDDDPEFLES